MGGEQNRLLCGSMLVGGGSRTKIPVSCVERGRWEYVSPHSRPAPVPPTMRHLLKQMAGCDISGRFAGQASLWQTSGESTAAASVLGRENLSDTLDTHGAGGRPAEKPVLRRGLFGDRRRVRRQVRRIDLFDKPATLQKLWDRLDQRILIDALELRDNRASGTHGSVKLYKK